MGDYTSICELRGRANPGQGCTNPQFRAAGRCALRSGGHCTSGRVALDDVFDAFTRVPQIGAFTPSPTPTPTPTPTPSPTPSPAATFGSTNTTWGDSTMTFGKAA